MELEIKCIAEKPERWFPQAVSGTVSDEVIPGHTWSEVSKCHLLICCHSSL